MNPFRGLECFDSEHALFFFGRAKAVENALEVLWQQAVAKRPFILVLGPGASGKTSLVRAGILPALTHVRSAERGRSWRVVFTRPTSGGTADPFDALAAALLEGAALREFSDATENGWQTLAAELRETPEDAALRLRETLQRIGAQAPDGSPGEQGSEAPLADPEQSVDPQHPKKLKPIESKVQLALVVDQLEELFVEGVPSEIQQKYIAALGALVKWRVAFVIAALRSSFSVAFQQSCSPKDIAVPDRPELVVRDVNLSEILAGRFDLAPLTPEEIREIIRSPADAAGLRFELDPGTGQTLDEALLEAATSVVEPLPLLEHLLSQLYRKQLRRADGLLSWSDYRELGGLEGALTNHAESVFSALDEDAQAALKPIIRQLASAGPGEDGVLARRTVPCRDLTSTPEFSESQKAGAERLIGRFTEEGLFHSETGSNADTLVSVSQECLLRNWPRVRQLLNESHGVLSTRDRLEPNFKHWLSGGRRSTGLLCTRSGIRDAKALLGSFRASLSDTQVDYLQRSLKGQRQHRRFRGAVIAILAALTIPAVILWVQWLTASDEQRKGERSSSSEGQIAHSADAKRESLEVKQKPQGNDARPPQGTAAFAASQLDALQRRLNDSEARAQQIQKSLELATSQRDTLQARLNDSEARVQEVQKSMQLASSQRDALQVQFNDSQARSQQVQNKLGVATSQRDTLQGQLKELSQKIAESSADQRDALQSRVNDSEASVQQILRNLEVATGQRDALQNQLKDAEAKAQQAQKDMALASSQRDALQSQLKDAVAKAQQAQKDAALASSQRDALQNQLKDTEAEAQQAQKNAALASSQRDALQNQLNDTEAKAQQAQKDAALASSQRDALQNQLNDTEAKAQQAQKAAALASSQRDALQGQLTQLKQTRVELPADQREALQAQLKGADERARQAQKDAALASSQRDSLQNQLNDAEAKAQQLQSDAAAKADQRDALQTQLQQAQKNAQVAAGQRDVLQARLTETEALGQQIQKKADLAISQRDALQAQLKDAKAKAQQVQTDAGLASSLADQRDTLQTQLQQAQQDARLAAGQRDALQARLTTAEAQVQQAQKSAEPQQDQQPAASVPEATPALADTQEEPEKAAPTPKNQGHRPASEPARAKKTHRIRSAHHPRETGSPSLLSQVRYQWNRFVQKVRANAP